MSTPTHTPRLSRGVRRTIAAGSTQLLLLILGVWRYQTEVAQELGREFGYHFVWMKVALVLAVVCGVLMILSVIIGRFTRLTRHNTVLDDAIDDVAFTFGFVAAIAVCGLLVVVLMYASSN